jgi:hypothetical protein
MDMRLSGEATSNRTLQPGKDALPSSLRYAAASPRALDVRYQSTAPSGPPR